ncbi:MAG: asparagine synthase (glutamine-hydrolyzing) [Actinomycetota bacterium]|nr:asparagine synthase (glutamine-hydrolyzing) [Actinomycetota bacterium]MDQ2957562.1 asparagine synthase (glutamine-hydrolyzing) [Actinomycetota bacterium]
MCRIFGNFGGPAFGPDEIERLRSAQLAGGPDEQSQVTGPNWCLGGNRLAIQGLDGGAQPYRLGEVHAVFNGEIYNHDELRADLRARGYRFSDHCDGTLIPALYLEHGDRFVELLDGMFAIALVDQRDRDRPRLLLANDPAGIKSLYYWSGNGDLVFSSELPAMLALPRVPVTVLPAKVDLYLSMLTVLGAETIFAGVRQLIPSSIVTVESGRAPRVAEYRTAITAPEPVAELGKAGEQFRELLDAEVQAMLRADVEVALITSGGLDSSLLTAMATRHRPGVHAFNIAYKGNWPSDERAFARQVADECGATYHQVESDPAEFAGLLPEMVAQLGQPNAAPHCLSTYLLFRAVRDAGFKVAVAGEGADEMFGGYERFARAMQGGSGWLDRYLDAMSPTPRSIRERIYSDGYRSLLAEVGAPSAEVRSIMAGFGDPPGLEDLLRYDQLERFPYYILRRTDHLSMASSVEVRVPFCQPKVVDFARAAGQQLKISDGKVKRTVYAAAEGLVPRSVLDRKKQPFTLPVGAMLRTGEPLFDFTREQLSYSESLYDYLDRPSVLGLLAEQAEQPSDAVAKSLWAILILDLWLAGVASLQRAA